jgi:hypothetical protein
LCCAVDIVGHRRVASLEGHKQQTRSWELFELWKMTIPNEDLVVNGWSNCDIALLLLVEG